MKVRISNQTSSGLVLLDVILAVTVFALVGTALIQVLGTVQNTSNSNRFERLLQYGLESALTEARHKPIREIPVEVRDETLGVTFETAVDTLEIANIDGNGLRDLYTVTVTAKFFQNGEEQTEKAEIYIYQTERK